MKKLLVENIEVKIYDSKKLMHRALSRLGYKKECAEAMVIPIRHFKTVKGKMYLQPLVAEMYIHRGIDVMILAHECLHAATSIIRRSRKSLNLGTNITVNEERLAYTQSMVFEEILKEFFPKKLLGYNLKEYDIEDLAKRSNKNQKE